MMIVLLAALLVAVVAKDSKPCFKYGEPHEGIKVSLGATANGCRDSFNMEQPNESHCVMSTYGAVDPTTWALKCEVFEKFVDDYIKDTTRTQKMKDTAIRDCNCLAGQTAEFGQTFITCWKKGLDTTCPEDKDLVGGTIKT